MKKIIDFIIFIFIVILSLSLPIFPTNLFLKICISVISIILAVILYQKNFKLFVPALFFGINALFTPYAYLIITKYGLYIPQINFLLPLFIYLMIVLYAQRFKKEITWFRFGKFDRFAIILTVILIFGSVIALVIWAFYIEDDFSRFEKFIPDIPVALLIVYGLAFPAFNAVFEEFIARAVLFDGFSVIFDKPILAILLQAIVFSFWHFQGFPGGLSGVILVFIWSIFLGIIRHRAKGMFPPILAHFFADLTIAIILYFIIIA